MSEGLIFYRAPHSRALSTAVLLDELGAPHTVQWLDLKAGEQRQPAFLAVNPMGKVPAIVHDGALVTEQAAITIYLADLFPEAGLTPGLRDADRGPYLRWLAFYGSCFEPAIVDKALGRPAGQAGMSPYGSFDDMFGALTGQLRAKPYMAGDRLTAADILWGLGLRWIVRFKLLPELPEIMAYIDRVASRPSVGKVEAEDAAMAARQAAATGQS